MTPLTEETMSGKRPLKHIETLVLVGIGGFAGSNLRFFVDSLLPGLRGTLLVNTLGSFLLGFILYEAIYANQFTAETRTILGTGFLASFTTYSTFILETVQTPKWALMTIIASYTLGFTGVLIGRTLAQRVTRDER